MKIPIRALDIAYILFVLAFATNPFFTVLATGDAAREGSPLTAGAWAVVYLTTIVRLVARRRQILPMLSDNLPLVLLVGIALGSFLWSIDPKQTLHHGAALLLTTLFALDLSLRYPITRQLQMVCIVLGTLMLLSVVVETIVPGLIPPGTDAEGVAWHGVFGFKNEFGRNAVFAAAAFLCLPLRFIWYRPFVLVSALGLAGLSRSAGALINLFVIIAVFAGLSMLWWKPKPRKVGLILGSVSLAISAYVLLDNFESFTALFGKDPHLTGRSELWRLAILSIRQRPLLGYGFTAFWGNSMQTAMRIRQAANWDAPHSHNGYIDLTLGLGMVGLALLVANYITLARRGVWFMQRDRSSVGKWPLLCVFFVIVYQIAEGSNVVGNSLVWIMFCSNMFSLARLRERVPLRVKEQVLVKNDRIQILHGYSQV